MSAHAPLKMKPAVAPVRMPTPAPFSTLQRKCACGGSGGSSGSSGECSECKKKKTLQRRAAGSTQPDAAPAIVHDVLRSPGQPLDAHTRAFFEPRFGHDFSRVRVHIGAQAAESARAIEALAYAAHNHIVFAAGHYSPETPAGRRLLAHELTHAIQQESVPARGNSPGTKLHIGNRRDASEQEADQVADQIAGVGHGGVQSAALAVAVIQRQIAYSEGKAPARQMTDDYLEEDDKQQVLQSFPDPAFGPVIRRQTQPDIPPPPPAFPAAAQWFLDVSADAATAWSNTCGDMHERGLWVRWNQSTNKSFAGDMARGGPRPRPQQGKCEGPGVNLGERPRDSGSIFTVGWFHTHPPAVPGCLTVSGPSETDLTTSSRNGLPGVLQEPATRDARSCSGNEPGPFICFGPDPHSRLWSSRRSGY